MERVFVLSLYRNKGFRRLHKEFCNLELLDYCRFLNNSVLKVKTLITNQQEKYIMLCVYVLTKTELTNDSYRF